MPTTPARALGVLLLLTGLAGAAVPPPPAPGDLADFPTSFLPDAPGAVSADALLDKPAGRNGPVVVRDGHFYSGDKRLRFWGVNVCFAANFPTHAEADVVAARLARFGINAVRFHHTDMAPYPRGIFADNSLTTLSPEALDRLDYFIAALKKQGVYANINLHISRGWARAKGWENADKLPGFDKIVDVFNPELIAANKQYAKDLLTHVNAYTKTRYADEPAVAMVEINNEDTLFIWGGEQTIATLPEPYAGQLKKLWNAFLVTKYGARDKLKAAWGKGELPLGPNLLADPAFATLGKPRAAWAIEQHEGAKMTVTPDAAEAPAKAVRLQVTNVTPTPWHLQLSHAGLKLAKGTTYTVHLRAKADKPTEISVGVNMAHAPWGNLGLAGRAKLTAEYRPLSFGFTAIADDDNGRLVFSVGKQVGTIHFADVSIATGGVDGLAADEDPAAGTVASHQPGHSATPARTDDWFDFLQKTDEAYWVDMRRYLREDLGVKAPITGTIGLGPLGTLSQSKMDFVDGHAYWQHPHFPRRPWDSRDWVIDNKAMADNPASATLWSLAATRVKGKPYTVTEYNHSAPVDYQAECVPMIAAYAALQDWDGIFMFSYAHGLPFDKGKISSYFDIEGNPAKMPLMPLGARIFLGQKVAPSAGQIVVAPARDNMLRTGSAYYHEVGRFVRGEANVQWADMLQRRFALDFGPHEKTAALPTGDPDPRIQWTGGQPAPGTGRFVLRDPSAAVFAGFAAGPMPIDLGALRIDKLDTPFATLTLVPADAAKPLATADRLLLGAVARVENTGMKWNAQRTSVSDQWGKGPARIEVVKATLSLPATAGLKAYALTAQGKRGPEIPVTIKDGRATLEIGQTPALWYELVR